MNTDVVVAELVRRVVLEVTAKEVFQIVSLAVQDGAALGVAKHLGMDEVEGCDMHDGDKIGQSAIGELVHSRMKVALIHLMMGRQLCKNFTRWESTFQALRSEGNF